MYRIEEIKNQLDLFLVGEKPTNENVKEFCKKVVLKNITNENTARRRVNLLNKAVEEYGVHTTLQEIVQEGLKFKATKEGLITREELDDYVSALENPQDQAILYCLFFGIGGKQMIELRELKENQINLDNKIIKLENRIVKIDDVFARILRDALEQDKYYPIKLSDAALVDEIPFNMASEYLIKQRQTKGNNMGTTRISYGALMKRLYTINTYLDVTSLKKDVLVKSGYAYKLHTELEGEVAYANVDRFIKENNLKVNVAILIDTYKDIYEK